MDESTAYLIDQARTLIWSGFYTLEDARETLEELAHDEGAGDLEAVRVALDAFAREKTAAEATWPSVTDCDRLDRAFAGLEADGVVALHNAGTTQSDGLSDVAEVAASMRSSLWGYVFYHEQDVAGALEGDGLWIAHGALEGGQPLAVAARAQALLEAAGLEVDWDGDLGLRLHVTMEWRRRGPA